MLNSKQRAKLRGIDVYKRQLLNSNVIGVGEGSSKKQAEQNAAREALKLMGYEF